MFKNILSTNFTKYITLYDRPLAKPRGKIIEIAYHPQSTYFNVQNFIHQSKKLRSHKVDIKEKAILQYTIVGKCIRFKKNQLNTSFIIRNIINLTSFEMTFALFTPIITVFFIRNYKVSTAYKKAHLYSLRKKQPVKSLVKFDYVINNLIYQDENFLQKKIYNLFFFIILLLSLLSRREHKIGLTGIKRGPEQYRLLKKIGESGFRRDIGVGNMSGSRKNMQNAFQQYAEISKDLKDTRPGVYVVGNDIGHLKSALEQANEPHEITNDALTDPKAAVQIGTLANTPPPGTNFIGLMINRMVDCVKDGDQFPAGTMYHYPESPIKVFNRDDLSRDGKVDMSLQQSKEFVEKFVGARCEYKEHERQLALNQERQKQFDAQNKKNLDERLQRKHQKNSGNNTASSSATTNNNNKNKVE